MLGMLAKAGRAAGGASSWLGNTAAGYWGQMPGMAQRGLIGAGIGATAGGFGVNPLGPSTPWDASVGGMFAGAAAGAGLGAGAYALRGQIGKLTQKVGGAIGGVGNRMYGSPSIATFGPLTRGQVASGYAGSMVRGFGQWTNRHGGTALLGIGAGSAGLIGNSLLGSNNSY
jgi:hypothetical protein